MKFRDIELLSSYLDGQLSPSESARLESRLSSDPNLRAILDDLREARGLLRQLPARKAPRNFRLTREMVGLKPPLPRAYPTFRFATAVATLLLAITFGINAIGPSLASRAAAPAAEAVGMGGGGGGCAEPCGFEPSLQVPAATESPATEAPVEPPVAAPSLALVPTETPPAAADSVPQSGTPVAKEAPTEETMLFSEETQRAPAPTGILVPANWQIALGIIAAIGALILFLMRRAAMQRWK
jgi:anti-sigma factor RsiW